MNRKAAILCLLFALILCLAAGCEDKNKDDGKTDEKIDENIAERWAVAGENDTAVMTFYKDGTAVFYGTKYKSYAVEGSFLRFTSEDGTVTSVRYYDEQDEQGKSSRFVYRSSEYKRAVETLSTLVSDDDPLVGVWKNGGLSFQFSNKGTFMEDGVLPGHYKVVQVGDENNIVLSYDGHLPDTVLFYKLDGDTLTVDYPWALVKMP